MLFKKRINIWNRIFGKTIKLEISRFSEPCGKHGGSGGGSSCPVCNFQFKIVGFAN